MAQLMAFQLCIPEQHFLEAYVDQKLRLFGGPRYFLIQDTEYCHHLSPHRIAGSDCKSIASGMTKHVG